MKLCDKCQYIANLNFLTSDNHLDLDAAYEEIYFLYNNYLIEDDSKLTKDARALKNKVLEFLNKIRELKF